MYNCSWLFIILFRNVSMRLQIVETYGFKSRVCKLTISYEMQVMNFKQKKL